MITDREKMIVFKCTYNREWSNNFVHNIIYVIQKFIEHQNNTSFTQKYQI